MNLDDHLSNGRRVDVRLCRPDRYQFLPSYEGIPDSVLKLIAENNNLRAPVYLTRCEIEESLSIYTRGSVAQAMLDLVEIGKITPWLEHRPAEGGWVMVWRLLE